MVTTEDRPPTDEALVRQARAGAPQALSELLRRHESALRRAVVPLLRNTHDVDDCLQEACLRVTAALPTFREDAHFEPWARQIAKNAAVSILRLRRTRGGLQPAHLQGLASAAFDPDALDPADALVRREEAHRIRRAIQELPARYRRVVELRLLRDLDHAEIARLLRLSHGAVRVLFCRGIRKVRLALKGSDARAS